MKYLPKALSEETCHFAILTIIPEELDAVKKIFGLDETVEKNGRTYFRGTVNSGGRVYTIVCAKSTDRSNNWAANFATSVIDTWNPKFLFVVGIAGGIFGNDNLKLGDVVVSKNVTYTEVKKRIEGKSLPRSSPLPLPGLILRNTHDVAKEKEWWNVISSERPDEEKPKAILGEILASETLWGDPNDPELLDLLEKYDKANAVDMESGGVASAVYDKSTTHDTKYIVIRGISDFCNKEGNQEARDTWKKYAAESAAAYALTLIKTVNLSTDANSEYLKEFLEVAPSLPETPFLLSFSHNDTKMTAAEFSDFVKSKKAVVLKGSAGGGKSFAATKISRDLASEGIIPIVLNFKNWRHENSEHLSGASLDDRMDVLLGLSTKRLSLKHLEKLDGEKWFILDGINEIPGGKFGDESIRAVLTTMNEYIRKNSIGSPILITDRMIERNFPESYFIVKINRLVQSFVKEKIDERFESGRFNSLTDSTKDLLTLPYFLDQALLGDNPDLISETNAIKMFFEKTLGFSKDTLDEISDAVYNVNESVRSLSFDEKNFSESIEMETYGKLIDSGTVLQSVDGTAKFDHQLKHEYLISRYLVRNQDWTVKNFDVATFDANSIDALFMSVEQLENKEDCDRFLKHVFDWNWPAAIRCTARMERRGAKNYSQETLIAICAFISQKKFDQVHVTSINAQKLLKEFEGGVGQELFNANDLSRVFEIVNGVTSEVDWFLKWRTLFTMENNSLSDENVNLIEDKKSLVGWTASNVFKRLPLNDIQQGQLRSLYRSHKSDTMENNTIRWRIVHPLGSFPSEENAKLLFDALDNDSYHWTRYGAARSLMEMAATTQKQELREFILNGFKERVTSMHPKVLEEMGNTSMHKKAVAGWEDEVKQLLQHVQETDIDGLDKNKWSDIVKKFNDGVWR